MSGSTTVAKTVSLWNPTWQPLQCSHPSSRCGTQPGNPRTACNPAAAVGPNLATLALHATQQPLWNPTWQPSQCSQPSSGCGTQPGNPRTACNPAAAVGPNLATLTVLTFFPHVKLTTTATTPPSPRIPACT
ncbi:hypothetical protein JOB18_040807 [Solea senegalensis]|uniref:Uncharacterized protein n=1 Tax=Solea senegalensis TaxID=28829 RepID=A0AAV6SIB7_SOLSE|nr:hypothetical protein JOB18_040807 [Solea senegalensis]